MNNPFDYVRNGLKDGGRSQAVKSPRATPQNARKRHLDPEEINLISLQDNYKRATAVYMKYQEAIRKSQILKSEILIGAREGNNPYELLAKAAECIGLLTGDTVYTSTMSGYLNTKQN